MNKTCLKYDNISWNSRFNVNIIPSNICRNKSLLATKANIKHARKRKEGNIYNVRILHTYIYVMIAKRNILTLYTSYDNEREELVLIRYLVCSMIHICEEYIQDNKMINVNSSSFCFCIYICVVVFKTL